MELKWFSKSRQIIHCSCGLPNKGATGHILVKRTKTQVYLTLLKRKTELDKHVQKLHL